MKINEKAETSGARNAPDRKPEKKPRSRFSDVLEADKQRAAVLPALPSMLPFSTQCDFAPVNSGPGVTPLDLQPLLTSLVQEIVVEAPPGGDVAVDIQFDSRTLEGLHVRIQKTEHGVEVKFSTASESVSRLLAASAPRLTEALAERGYVTPSVSIQRPQDSPSHNRNEAGHSGRDRNERGGQEQRGGQKRR